MVCTIHRMRALAACVALLTIALALPLATHAQTGERCFPQTGFCISGPIRAYWEANGGLPVFGYPIAERRSETIEGTWTGPTQWFERDRLEDHANEGKGVLAGRLGAQFLERDGRPWQRGNDGPKPGYALCTKFEQTGYNVCGSFGYEWQNNGGLARFGYPLTQAFQEVIEGKSCLVQYFERRRMEYHPEIPEGQNPVLLGLLGRTLFNTGVVPPQPAASDVSGATQQAILDAAYASARAQYPQGKLAIGLVEVTSDSAVALAQPFNNGGFTVALRKRGGAWQVVPATETPGGDAAAIIGAELAQVQDARGAGLNAYVTRPRIAGDWARISLSPGAAENLDGASVFFKRENNDWHFVTAGSAFPEDDLRALGVPQALWSYGEGVRGPNA